MVKRTHKGISTLIAALLIIALVIVTGVVFYTLPKFNGFTLLSYPTSLYSGEEFSVTVTAVDQYGKPFTSYAGSVYFTSTDTNAIIPEPGTQNNPYTFKGGDKGIQTFDGFKFTSAKSWTITVTDGKESMTSMPITVKVPPFLDHFKFSPINSPQAAGVDFNITVTAVNQYGDTMTDYSGTPTLTCSIGSIRPIIVSSWSSGVGTATVRVTTAGTGVTMIATDNTIIGISNPFVVNPAYAVSFKVNAPATATMGVPFTVTVIAIDQYGNMATGYSGTVHFTSNDVAAKLPSDYTFTAGDNSVHTFTNGITLSTAINWSITVTDRVTTSITGSYKGIMVSVNPPSYVGFGYASGTHDYGSLSPEYPLDLQANDLILLQVVGDANFPSYAPSGFTLLYGPDQTGPVSQWIYYTFADGTESGKKMALNYIGQCSKAAWMFAFRNVALTKFIEAGSFGSGDSAIIAAQPVTTTGSNRLAVSFVFVGSASALGHWNNLDYGFIGENGGDWVNLRGDFNFSTTSVGGINLTLQMQVATMNSAGTISGGSYKMTNSDSWGVRAFALMP